MERSFIPMTHRYLGTLDVNFLHLARPCKSVCSKTRYYSEHGIAMPEEKILKTLYFSSRGGRLYGAVIPGSSEVDVVALEATIIEDLDAAHSSGRGPRPHYSTLGLRKASVLPSMMDYGTCSPCISADDVKKDWRGKPRRGCIGRIVVDVDDWSSVVDLPLPGRADIAMHARLDDVMRKIDEYSPGILMTGHIRVRPVN